jgi:CubicO group peptidase (beta-lactamase class C family)
VVARSTAAAVLLLAQRHPLSFDDTLAQHLDGFPAWAGTVTLDQLIHHTTGIPEYIDLFDAKGYWRTDLVTQQMIVDELRAVRALRFPPGDHWEYSDSNYILLAEIVSRVSGTDFPTFLRRTIFDPLDLSMVVDAVNPIPGRAVNYDTDTGVLRANDNEQWQPVGEGALQTTPSDLVRWADPTGFPGSVASDCWLRRWPIPSRPGRVDRSTPRACSSDRRVRSATPGQWLGFQSLFEVSADRTRSLAVFCNSWSIDMGAVADPYSAIWTTPSA